MAPANQAIGEIGMPGFQWKMLFLNGFGYAVDSVSLAAFDVVPKTDSNIDRSQLPVKNCNPVVQQ